MPICSLLLHFSWVSLVNLLLSFSTLNLTHITSEFDNPHKHIYRYIWNNPNPVTTNSSIQHLVDSEKENLPFTCVCVSSTREEQPLNPSEVKTGQKASVIPVPEIRFTVCFCCFFSFPRLNIPTNTWTHDFQKLSIQNRDKLWILCLFSSLFLLHSLPLSLSSQVRLITHPFHLEFRWKRAVLCFSFRFLLHF